MLYYALVFLGGRLACQRPKSRRGIYGRGRRVPCHRFDRWRHEPRYADMEGDHFKCSATYHHRRASFLRGAGAVSGTRGRTLSGNQPNRPRQDRASGHGHHRCLFDPGSSQECGLQSRHAQIHRKEPGHTSHTGHESSRSPLQREKTRPHDTKGSAGDRNLCALEGRHTHRTGSGNPDVRLSDHRTVSQAIATFPSTVESFSLFGGQPYVASNTFPRVLARPDNESLRMNLATGHVLQGRNCASGCP